MINLNRTSRNALYEQLYLQIKNDITAGMIAPDSRLPATRTLADELGISRNTVTAAYYQLELEGYLHAIKGSGFYVNSLLNLDLIKNTSLEDPSFLPVHEDSDLKKCKYDFQYGNIDGNIFPTNSWRKCIISSFDSIADQTYLSYTDKQGEFRLRIAISNYLYQTRGVRCTPKQILITSGHQHSLQLLTKLLPKEEYSVSLEEPGYDGTRAIFEMNKYDMNTVHLEDDGISIDDISRLKNTLLYVTPSHQFPTGCVCSISKRLEILNWARKHNSYIIEDDYDSELRYHMLPVPSLQSLDQSERTIYLGTFSKSLSPDLRIAYVVLPELVLKNYNETFKLINCTVPKHLQIALAEFFENGSYERHINMLKTHYKKKYDLICSCIKKTFGKKAAIQGSSAGLHLLLSINSPYKQHQIIKRALDCDVQVYPTDIYWKNKKNCPQNQILLGFSSIHIHDIPTAIEKLHQAVYE